MAESSQQAGTINNVAASLHELILNLPITEELSTIVQDTPICPENPNLGIENCALEQINFIKKEGKLSSEGQRVLIIDEGKFPLAYTRYHKRVLDLLEPDEEGWYHTTKKPLFLPKNLKKIFKDILGEKYSDLSASVLKTIFRSGLEHEIDEKFRTAMDFTFTGQLHGALVMALIAEYSPEAEIIIAQSFGLTDIPEFCNITKDNEALVSFGSYLNHAVLSMQELILENKIHWINYSAGNTRQTLDQDAIRKCGKVFSDNTSKLILQTLLDKFYRPLSSMPGVLFVQAGLPHLSHSHLAEDPNFTTDCTNLPQRLRVGVFTADKEHKLAPLGENRFDLLDQNQKTKWPCIDTYLNIRYKHYTESDSKYDDDQTLLRLTNGWNDFGIYNRTEVTGSFAAPILVSHLIHRKKNIFSEMTMEDFLLESKHRPHGKMIDPALYQHFEAFRLNILPVNKCEVLRLEASQRGLVDHKDLQELRQTNKFPILNSTKTNILKFLSCNY